MQRESKTAAKRTVILTAAAELFTAKDFHLVLMDEVAERARVGKGTLYRYFSTKEDLYFAIIFEGWERLREHLVEALQAEGSIEESLEKLSRQILSYFWQRRHFVTLVHRLEHSTSRKEQTDWRRRREGIVRLVESVLQEGIACGVLPNGNVRLITEMFFGMLRSIILYRGSRDTPDVLAHLAVRLFLDGFRSWDGDALDRSVYRATGGKSYGRDRTATLL